MSRAFVKEDAQGPDEDPAEKPVSDQPNYVTPRGLKALQDEEEKLLAELKGYEGAQDDEARKKKKRELERDLRYVRARLEGAIPVDPANQPKDQIRFGASVVLRRGDGVEKRVRIVGEDESEEGGETLSWAAPFAQVLYGLKAGRTLDWETEAGAETWTVVAIDYGP
ncbi:MAG: GreA/GreB family elongation factor [Elusimicrobia bacterium]|nr:GreA/GreB family elongation factor [Elusimicrobiota bacterium]